MKIVIKIVINSEFGIFGLSDKAKLRYAELKGIKLYPEVDKDYERYWKEIKINYYTHKKKRDIKYYFNDFEIDRTDKDLIKVVEELGREANSKNAILKIVEIPDGIKYNIREYSGAEFIEEETNPRTWF